MSRITLISTRHKEHGKCNADELASIIREQRPEVIFVEAPKDLYSKSDRMRFEEFGVYHPKLEIGALQKLGSKYVARYMPVLDFPMTNLFDEIYGGIPQSPELDLKSSEFDNLQFQKGFAFLNSQEGMAFHTCLRNLVNSLMPNKELLAEFDVKLNKYEDSMIANIYSYSKNNSFEKAVFLCGSAHRASLNEKFKSFEIREKLGIKWDLFGD